MTTQNYNEGEEYHLIQPYDGSYEPNHYDEGDDEPSIIEDEDEEEVIEEEEAYL